MPKSTHAMTRVAGLLVAASLIAAPVRAEPTTDAAVQAEQSSSAAESWMMIEISCHKPLPSHRIGGGAKGLATRPFLTVPWVDPDSACE